MAGNVIVAGAAPLRVACSVRSRASRPLTSAVSRSRRRWSAPGDPRSGGTTSSWATFCRPVDQITARQAAVKAGIGMDVPALTINKVCLSASTQPFLADQPVRAGEFEIVVGRRHGVHDQRAAPAHGIARGRQRYGDKVIDSMAFDGLTCVRPMRDGRIDRDSQRQVLRPDLP